MDFTYHRQYDGNPARALGLLSSSSSSSDLITWDSLLFIMVIGETNALCMGERDAGCQHMLNGSEPHRIPDTAHPPYARTPTRTHHAHATNMQHWNTNRCDTSNK